MSLSKLPAELIVQISSFLDLPDIWQLRQINWRTYTILKRYRLDKPSLEELRLSKSYNANYTLTAKLNSTDTSFDIATLNTKEQAVAQLHKVAETCAKIKVVRIGAVTLNNTLADILIKNSEVIHNISLEFTTIRCTSDKLIEIGEKFKDILLKEVKLARVLRTDQVFSEILPTTQIVRSKRNVVVDTCLTDKVLEAMIVYGKTRSRMILRNYRTYITVEGIRNLMQKVVTENHNGFIWHFGILASDQQYAAKLLLNEVNSDEKHRFVVNQMPQPEGFVYEFHERDETRVDDDSEEFDIFNNAYEDFCMIFFCVEF